MPRTLSDTLALLVKVGRQYRDGMLTDDEYEIVCLEILVEDRSSICGSHMPT